MKNSLFVGIYHRANTLSYIGMSISIIGIYFAVSKSFTMAMICLVVAGIADLFDGRFASKFKRTEQEKQFGIQVDSLVDVVSFLVFPTVIVISFSSNIYLSIISAIFYCFAGITRLGSYNVNANDESKNYFEGMPVTYSALILSLVGLLVKFNLLSSNYIIMIMYVVCGLLFILNIKFQRPRLKGYIFFALLALVVLSVYLFI